MMHYSNHSHVVKENYPNSHHYQKSNLLSLHSYSLTGQIVALCMQQMYATVMLSQLPCRPVEFLTLMATKSNPVLLRPKVFQFQTRPWSKRTNQVSFAACSRAAGLCSGKLTCLSVCKRREIPFEIDQSQMGSLSSLCMFSTA